MGRDEEKTREMLNKDLTVGLHHPTAFQRCCAICSMLLTGFQEVVHSVYHENIKVWYRKLITSKLKSYTLGGIDSYWLIDRGLFACRCDLRCRKVKAESVDSDRDRNSGRDASGLFVYLEYSLSHITTSYTACTTLITRRRHWSAINLSSSPTERRTRY
jgi:hypothetical protein